MTRKRLAVFVSGRGSNLRALANFAQEAGDECAYEITLVAADAPCPAIDFAKEHTIETRIIDPQDRMINKGSTKKIAENFWLQNIDFIALSGFMCILRPTFVVDWIDQIVNIHPSLLPKFPGLDTHARALAASETQHGCSIHFVDSGIDTGKLIAQAILQIDPDDTADTLAARVLRLEHALYGQILQQICLHPNFQFRQFTEAELF